MKAKAMGLLLPPVSDLTLQEGTTPLINVVKTGVGIGREAFDTVIKALVLECGADVNMADEV